MLTKFKLMWYGLLGRISVARHLIEVVDEKKQPVYSAPYHVEQKKRKFEEIGIEKMLPRKIIEPAQTERVVKDYG